MTKKSTSGIGGRDVTSRKRNSDNETSDTTMDQQDAAGNDKETTTGSYSVEQLIQFKTTEEYEKTVKWLKANHGKCKDQISGLKAQWNLNLSFYKGDQYCDVIGNSVIKTPAPKSKVRLVVNRIRPMIRTELARLTSQNPTAEVVPASSEQSDVMAAKAAESIFVSSSERLNLQKVFRRAAWWSSVCGVGYVKTQWNPNSVTKYPDGEQAQGDFGISAVSPFHVLVPDLMVEEIEDQPYVMNTFALPFDQVKAMYGQLFKDDYEPTLISSNEIMDESRLNLKGGNNKAKPDSCLVIECWIKPGTVGIMPKGGLITLVDDVIVQYSDQGMPYEHGEYPFTKIENIPTGSYYSASSIEDMIPLQREINRIRSTMMEARNKMANPGIMYPAGAIDPNRYTNGIGQMVEIKAGMAMPQPLPTPTLPPVVMEEHSQIIADIEDITGQHQVSKGNTPAGVTAATAIQYLQEQDNSYMSTSFDSVEYAMQKIAKQFITLFIQYADSYRQVKVVGKDQSISVQRLMGSDIKTGTDVRIEGGSSLPHSKAARIAMFTDWMGKGFIPAEQGLDLMDLPHMEDYYKITKADERKAERENLKITDTPAEEIQSARDQLNQQKNEALLQLAMQTGYPGLEEAQDEEGLNQILEEFSTQDPQAAQTAAMFDKSLFTVNDFDKHEIHIEVHNRYRKSQGYEMLDDIVREEMDRHVSEHEAAMQQKQMEQMFFDEGQAGDPNMIPEEGMEEGEGEEGDNQFTGAEGEDTEEGIPDQGVDTSQQPI